MKIPSEQSKNTRAWNRADGGAIAHLPAYVTIRQQRTAEMRGGYLARRFACGGGGL
jgi:hypothetical protein